MTLKLRQYEEVMRQARELLREVTTAHTIDGFVSDGDVQKLHKSLAAINEVLK